MKTPAMYIAIPFGDIIDAMRANGVVQPVLNEIDDKYCEELGQYGRVSIYTNLETDKRLHPEVLKVVRQWQEAGFIPNDPADKYAYFFLYYDN